MELKPGYLCPLGYKQTEVGLIPEEWNPTSLKGKIGIAHGFAFASEHFASHGKYRLTTPGHFNEAGGFRDIGEKQKYYDGPVPSDYVLRPGDLIVAMTEQADGLLGSAAVIPKVHGYLHNQRLGRVKSLSSEIELAYLFYVFNSPSYRAKVRETAAGTKVKHTSPGKLLEISVRLPPIPEQRAIAGVLSDVDGLIGALDQLIAKKRDLKQATMQQLLTGKTRLPGFSGEWEVKRIGEFTDCTAGGTPSTAVPAYWGGSIRWMSSGELNLKIVNEVEGRITELGLQNSSTKIVPVNCVLIGLAGQGKTRGTVAVNHVELCTNQSIAAIFPITSFESTYLYYNLDFRYDELRPLSAGDGGRGGLNLKIIRSILVPFPKLEEQTAIAEVLSDMDAELAALEQRRDKTRDLKQGMMQELLTGRTRLI